jgi:hypothetical protein
MPLKSYPHLQNRLTINTMGRMGMVAYLPPSRIRQEIKEILPDLSNPKDTCRIQPGGQTEYCLLQGDSLSC